jgi:DNA-binding GntR family transcriptional regulator
MDPLTIDPRSSEPSYREIARQIRERIESGELADGDPLPSINRIRQETGVAVNTVRHAIALLVAEGWAQTVQGRATYARRP